MNKGKEGFMSLDGKESPQQVFEEKLSMLMDDELPENEKALLIQELKTNPELQKTWERYHLIRAVLQKRSEESLLGQTGGIAERVQAEIAKADAAASRGAEFDRPIVLNTSHSPIRCVRNAKQG